MLAVGTSMSKILKEVKAVASNTTQLVQTFFHDLKKYNETNFRNIQRADLSVVDPEVLKAFSSVITRYFIFCEKHPEISKSDQRILFFKLKIDLVARYFSECYDPEVNAFDYLKSFQLELHNYLKDTKGGVYNEQRAAFA